MDRAAIEELYAYTGWAWERIERTIDALPAGAYEGATEASGWPSIAACITHFASAYDGWINGAWALGLGETTYPADYPAPVTSWPSMKAYRQRLRASFRLAFDQPDDVVFTKHPKDYGLGEESLSRADILTNLLLHERGHHGDLNTLFHQHGIRSYIIDYRFFVTRNAHFDTDEPDAG